MISTVSHSQAAQDLFVCTVLKGKKNGRFLEIGANHPQTHNNTFILEKSYEWSGHMVEYAKGFDSLYRSMRPRSTFSIADATTLDYAGILRNNHFDKYIDYLQIDLDVDNKSTLKTLQLLDQTVFDTFTFATVTFEHDSYRGNFFDTQSISRNIFAKRGYELVFPDVSVFWMGGYKPFEDWYVHPDLVDMNFVNSIRSTVPKTVDELKTLFEAVSKSSK